MARSTAASRAAVRDFWTSKAVWQLGRILDALGVAVGLVSVCLPVVVVLLSVIRACPTEDSTFCTWDSSTGTSFVALWEGFTFPLPK